MDEEKDLNDVSVLANLADNEIWKVPVGNLVNAIDNAADTMENLHGLLAAAEKELQEQARLNGMGAEREAALLAKLERSEKELVQAKRIMDIRLTTESKDQEAYVALKKELALAQERIKELEEDDSCDFWREDDPPNRHDNSPRTCRKCTMRHLEDFKKQLDRANRAEAEIKQLQEAVKVKDQTLLWLVTPEGPLYGVDNVVLDRIEAALKTGGDKS